MRKDFTTAKPTNLEILRNKIISKIRYIVEQYFGISHLHNLANRDGFPSIIKNKFDAWFRQAAFNVARGIKIISRTTIDPQLVTMGRFRYNSGAFKKLSRGT